ncbi:MAG: glutaminyl-peptide cyclotransferase [Caldilineales bacterium]
MAPGDAGQKSLPPPPSAVAEQLSTTPAETNPGTASPLATPFPTDPSPTPTATVAPSLPSPEPTPALTEALATAVFTYQVVATYPHDPEAFTQGLVYQDGIFYEGTGLRGRSSLRKVDPVSGKVTQRIELPDRDFGEGIAILGDKLYQLTWQENTGFIYDKDSFELLDTWTYPGEGWGLTTDGERLIMSDGTNSLRFLDPETLEETGRVDVVDTQGRALTNLNELEYIDSQVYANIWQTDWIARIDPATGLVRGWIDLRGLLPAEDRTQPVDVLNGIAYDPASDRLFVTGKLWPALFEIDLVPADSQ